MESDDSLVDSTDLVANNVVVVDEIYPNEATAMVCGIIEDVCPDLSFLQLSDFRGSIRTHVEKHRGDGLVFRFILISLNTVDWDFVGTKLKDRQNV